MRVTDKIPSKLLDVGLIKQLKISESQTTILFRLTIFFTRDMNFPIVLHRALNEVATYLFNLMTNRSRNSHGLHNISTNIHKRGMASGDSSSHEEGFGLPTIKLFLDFVNKKIEGENILLFLKDGEANKRNQVIS